MIPFTHSLLKSAEQLADERAVLRKKIINAVSVEYPEAVKSRVLNDGFEQVSTELLRMFVERIESGIQIDRFEWLYFANSATSSYSVICYQALTTIKGFAGSFDAEEAAKGTVNYDHLEDLIHGENGTAVTLALMEAALRLASDTKVSDMVITAMIFDGEDILRHGYYIANDDLSRMIAENPDKLDDILNVVLSMGGFTRTECVWEALESSSLPLCAGAL